MDSAEQAALSPQPDAPVRFYDARKLNVFGADGRIAPGSREVTLSPSRHFDHLSVNTSMSSVLMPPSVSESDPEVTNSIQWSEHLDPLFANNYEIDPSLSWQFFGSSSGFLRRYPAMAWPPEDPGYSSARGVYDFRSSQWFVGAATSPKDLVILVDTSGSMTGARSQLARSTVFTILDTLGNNDFVNVYKFSDITEELVPCFKDSLVQANPDNVRDLKNAVDGMKPENVANFTAALTQAFEILYKYNRTGLGCQCNQAIMLITDGPAGEHTATIKRYNWPHMPVRMFTYLVGTDSSSAKEMKDMACTNKGYYTRIESTDEIREKVLNYIYVMARPMVMYQNDHPIQWSPVYVGGKSNSLTDRPEGQLMTTVTTPIFDRRNHSARVANLLGVVGTDVPVEQIQKLVPSYKLGVNGYSFVVNNNGHVLYHPDLRPLLGNDQFLQSLKPSYTSVDFTEVELAESEVAPRENHSTLLDLRHDLIEQKEGETEMGVKIHYDNMRRAATRRHKYFYNPVEGTPFSLGLALPEGYGMYELQAEQEIRHSPVNVTEYFKGTNWKVHPDWVYCEYNSASDQKFASPEEQVLHFMARAGRPGWKWMSMRPRSHHAHKKADKDSYFCDKTLVQSLVRDAIVTEGLDRHPAHSPHKEEKQQGYQMFGVTLSFIATRSGLFRWTDHNSTVNDPTIPGELHFSELNHRAMEQSWYRRAVDQHSVEPESFVFSVDFADDARIANGGRPLVTATHAVFVEHKGHRAPAAVVGLQFQHHTLASHFKNITSACTGTTGCRKTCASEELDCYLLDNNGFIILSEDSTHTGRFFGQIDGTIMDSLVQDRIYKKVPVFDYQGACSKDRNNYSGTGNRIRGYQPLRWLVHWITRWTILMLSLFDVGESRTLSLASEEDTTYPDEYENGFDYPPVEEERIPETPIPPPPPPVIPSTPVNRSGARPCDLRTDLYVLQPDRLNTSGLSNPLKGKLTNCHVTGCERPFSVQKIPHSNLILLVVDTLCPCGSKQLHITSVEVPPGEQFPGQPPCRHAPRQHLYRRRPPKCINYHPEETEIDKCSGASHLKSSLLTLLVCVAIAVKHHLPASSSQT